MNEQDLINRIELLEYHQKLLVMLLKDPTLEYYKLIIEKGISELETKRFFYLCDELSKKMEEQKAEGFVYFHPLFDEFLGLLPANLVGEEVVKACLIQQLYVPLFQEFKKYI